MTAKSLKANNLIKELNQAGDPADAIFLQRFFKTGKGQYGEGDVFIGVRIPAIRSIAKAYNDLSFTEIQKLLSSNVHEERFAALVILTSRYLKASAKEQSAIYDFYLGNLYKGRINNWDLIDVSTEYIIGAYLLDKPSDILFELAKSSSIWQRRAAIVSTFAFIKRGDPKLTIKISEQLLKDPESLIQKATGWMLREVGKRCDRQVLLSFLDKHAHEMPRTMLRYSIEHLSPQQRKHYMNKKI